MLLPRCAVSSRPARWQLLAFAAWLVLASAAVAPASAAAEANVIEAARKEGRVTWLTSQIIGELAEPLAAAFKSAYGIDVTILRATPRFTAERLVQAARTPQTGIDVVDGRSSIPQLKRAGLLSPLPVGLANQVPKELVDRDGFWVASNIYVNAVAINTELVPADRRPRSLEDLLSPEWTGKMVWSGQQTLSGVNGFIGTVLRGRGREAGRDFLGKLAQQQIASFEVSSRQIVEKVIAGEYSIALQVFNHQAAISAGRGAPIAWLPIQPMAGSVTAIGLTRQSLHPNAARLFMEFLISRQGQEIFREADQIPALREVEPKDPSLRLAIGEPGLIFFTPEDVDAGMQDWQALRTELFR